MDKGAALFNRAFDHIANGLLLYVIFYAFVWLLIAKGGFVAQAAAGPVIERFPAMLTVVVVPFLASTMSAFLAHAGLRWTLKRLRLRLSTSESAASRVFLILLALFAFTGLLFDPFDGLDGRATLTHAMILAGAWTGIALRRRVPI